MDFAAKLDRRRMILRSTCTVGLFSLTGYFPNVADSTLAAVPQAKTEPRTKAVINLFLTGGPSQMDTFDYKPELARYEGKPLPFKTPVMANSIQNKIFPSPFKFEQHGSSGIWVSELLPNLAECVDDLTLIHSMYHAQPDHVTAICYANTGYERSGRPSLGARVLFGLGAENENLPGFVSLYTGDERRDAVACGFLPPSCQATTFHGAQKPMADLTPREPLTELQQNKRSFLQQLNRLEAEHRGANSLMEATDACYDRAMQMQTSVPELYNLQDESAETLALYGINEEQTKAMGTHCLVARRLIERGVRFVQVNHENWDHHGGLTAGIRQKTKETDRPIAGLLKDLKQRGLFDQTLVMWGGEFGRTPIGTDGREHNPYGYTMWMAGGGTRRGFRYGTTDEFGYYAEEKKVKVHDLHATVLHLLGLDPDKLTYRFGGRDFRLTDVDGEVVKGVLA